MQLDADFYWLADTGATSHMTPNRSWLRNYTLLRLPIRLANDTIVYSEGVGSVLFHPKVGGKEVRAVEFTRVLHVPQLQNNLLSVLFLVKHRGMHIRISSDDCTIQFSHSGQTAV